MGRPSGGGASRGGGSRSSGGSRGGGHRSAGSSRSSHRPSGGGSHRPSGGAGRPSGGFGGPSYRPRPHGGPGMPPPPPFGGPGYPPPRRHYRRSNPVSYIVSFITVIVFLMIMWGFMNQYSGNNVMIDNQSYANTTKRTKLDASVTAETDYYYDNLGYISQQSVLLKGLKHFYSETGVQPIVYITDDQNAKAAELYDQLCHDEGHFLLVVIGAKDGSVDWEYDYVWGAAASSIMDKEAEDIFFAYLDSYYYGSFTDEEVFANAFSKTADTIMSSTTNGYDLAKVVVIGVVIVVVLMTLIQFWKAWKKQKNKEQEDLERTLNTPLEEFGNPELKDLKDKYDD